MPAPKAAALAGLSRLARLRILGNPPGDAGLAAVCRTPRLVDLDISRISVADWRLGRALPAGLAAVALGPLEELATPAPAFWAQA